MTKFSDLGLDPKVLAAVSDAGYETPTPIQAGAIPHALRGRDVLGIAQTGTGKTASFTLPMITLLAKGRARARMPRSLVLCPTRELAAQVAENFDIYAKNTKLTKALLIGGVSFKEQDALIDRGVDVLIATPGRLLDHFERGKLLLTGVQIMVVDEADRMLDMGFIPDIERIFQMTPFTRQTLFFSATMAPEIERITNTFLSNPEKIEVARAATTGENIEQGVVMFKASRKDKQASEKRALLRALIDGEGEACTNAIIFCNRKTEVDIVAKSLNKYGYDAAPIHGDLDQSQRMRTLDAFREGKLRFLCASDVAARGLDVPAVSHVFNYDVPSHAEDYVHRIGRTGRAGRKGKAMMICVPHDEKNFADIENLVKKEIPRLENPLKTAAPKATDTAKDEQPKPKAKSSSRSRSKPAPKDEQPQVEAPQPVAATAPSASESTKSSSRSKSSRGRSGRGRDDQVVGMGDHVPAFILRSFKPA
ncbi:DEAD/DEAH box helicase [Actibacterium sp. XHP0104]|uniref:DEAD/DEAH box helicase n=1 Tax=Actibacterium sp. XHP0104 TaxID=2984335 RepID=UPI0021E847C9|nr:DEAD/DEAH box helicase [Actibacterium sp. XHP0104]MCV2880704.1 DEAD/DEAH box helicase [Actibacterium sp. XHP0104]